MILTNDVTVAVRLCATLYRYLPPGVERRMWRRASVAAAPGSA